METSFGPPPGAPKLEQLPLKMPHQSTLVGEPVGINPPPSASPLESQTPPPTAVPPENLQTSDNPATTNTLKFMSEKKHGFLRSLGHVIRTATGEFFTWFGAPLIPAGFALAAKAFTNPDVMKEATKNVLQDPTIQARIAGTFGTEILKTTLDNLQPLINATPVLGAGIGVATSVIGLISNRIGTAMGWKSAKQGGENIQNLYQLGKLAELSTATLAIFNPALSFLYPIAKGFSIAATFIAHTKRP